MEKKININFGEKKYEGKIESNDEQNINIIFENGGMPAFKGSITLKDIYQKLPALEDYTMKNSF